jgi:hypothetical protein
MQHGVVYTETKEKIPMYANEDRDKCIFLGLILAIVLAVVVLIGYYGTLNPETITGVVVDKEKVVTSHVHYSKDVFFVTYSTSYRVRVQYNEGEETFSTGPGTYETVKVGQEGSFKVSGVKWMGRVFNGGVE